MDREDAINIDKIIDYAIDPYKEFINSGGRGLLDIEFDKINASCFDNESNHQEIRNLISTAQMHQGVGVLNNPSNSSIINKAVGIGPAIIKFKKRGGMLGVYNAAIAEQNRQRLEREINIQEKQLNIKLQSQVLNDYPQTKENANKALKLAEEQNKLSKDANDYSFENNKIAWSAILISSAVLIFEVVKLIVKGE